MHLLRLPSRETSFPKDSVHNREDEKYNHKTKMEKETRSRNQSEATVSDAR